MTQQKAHNYNPRGEIALRIAKEFQGASLEMFNHFKKAKETAPNHIIHGMELEGFILKPDGHIAAQSAQQILENLDGDFEVESGGHQIEFRSRPLTLTTTNYDELVDDIEQQRKLVDCACKNVGFDFVTRGIPLNLPNDLENELDLFTTDTFFTEHRAYDQEIMGLLDEPFQVKYKNGRTAFHMKDYTLGLSLISGVHNNISFTQPETAFMAFNMALQLTPLFCALGANGSSLDGKRLLKRDNRLHIGLMSESLLVKLDHDPYLDAGLPVPLINGWDEYIHRLISLGFMLPDDELEEKKDDFLALYDNLREQSWAFAKVKIFSDNRLGIEFRPLSAQCNTESNVAFHMFIVWTLNSLMEQKSFQANSWEDLGFETQSALKFGPDSLMNFNGKRASAITHFYDIAAHIKPIAVQKEWATESTFDHVVKVVQSAIDFNAEELINYQKYNSKIRNDFKF